MKRIKLEAAIRKDIIVALELAAITYERLARESGHVEVTSMFANKAMEAKWLSRNLRGETNDMATPARYV